MSIEQIIENDSAAMNKAGHSKLAFFLQKKISAIRGLIAERDYWRKRAIEAEKRAETLNELYLSATSNEILFIQLLQKNVSTKNATAKTSN